GAAQGLRPDAGAALGDLDGVLRERRRLLPLFVLRGARLRPHRARGRLRSRLSADGRGAALRNHSAPAEDQTHAYDSALIKTRRLLRAAARRRPSQTST